MIWWDYENVLQIEVTLVDLLPVFIKCSSSSSSYLVEDMTTGEALSAPIYFYGNSLGFTLSSFFYLLFWLLNGV